MVDFMCNVVSNRCCTVIIDFLETSKYKELVHFDVYRRGIINFDYLIQYLVIVSDYNVQVEIVHFVWCVTIMCAQDFSVNVDVFVYDVFNVIIVRTEFSNVFSCQHFVYN